MAQIILIAAPPVQHDDIVTLQILLELGRTEPTAAVGVRVKLLIVAQRNQFFL